MDRTCDYVTEDKRRCGEPAASLMTMEHWKDDGGEQRWVGICQSHLEEMEARGFPLFDL